MNVQLFLPILVISPIILLSYILFSIKSNARCLREIILSAILILGAITAFFTEIISYFSLLNFQCIIFFWISVNFVLLWRTNKIRNANIMPFKQIIFNLRRLNKYWWVLIFIMFLFFIIIFITGILSAPNNWDSMAYHLSRVCHWIQNQSLFPYATHIERQLYQAPYAEILILHLQLLTNSDLFSFSIQFFSMIFSIIGVSLITKDLGGMEEAQLLAGFFCICLPMGILQASSTQNDYLLSFFIISLLYFLIRYFKDQSWFSVIMVGVSLGLSIYTKNTGYLFALPLMGVFLIPYIYTRIHRQMILSITDMVKIVTMGLLALSLNIANIIRNILVYGNFLGTSPEIYTTNTVNQEISLNGFSVIFFKNLCLQFTSPNPFNIIFNEFFVNFARFFHLKINDLRYSFGGGSEYIVSQNFLHEDEAGNLIAFLIILIICIYSLYRYKRFPKKYFLIIFWIFTAFSIFSIYLTWQPWGNRLILPLFVSFSPIFGIFCERFEYKKFIPIICIIMIISSTPFLLHNSSRPLFGDNSLIGLDLNKNLNSLVYYDLYTFKPLNREYTYFNNQKQIQADYLDTVYFIETKNISSIGITMDFLTTVGAFEYPLWMLLCNKKDHLIKIEHINVNNPSAKFSMREFIPDIILTKTENKPKEISYLGTKYTCIKNNKLIAIYSNKLLQ